MSSRATPIHPANEEWAKTVGEVSVTVRSPRRPEVISNFRCHRAAPSLTTSWRQGHVLTNRFTNDVRAGGSSTKPEPKLRNEICDIYRRQTIAGPPSLCSPETPG